MRCYDLEMDFDLEDLGEDGWLTGCPLCGGPCHVLPQAEIARIDEELDSYTSEA